jgi:hypothetical protein
MNSGSLDKARMSVERLVSPFSMTQEFDQQPQKKLGELARVEQNQALPVDIVHSP